jgi:two-component system, NarL family, sensor histidine kinase LiaS
MMNIFRQLRWKLTLSYTLVTVGAFLVVLLIIGGIVYTQIFVPENVLTPQGLVEIVQKNTVPMFSPLLSKSPVDTESLNAFLRNPNSQITSRDFLRIGEVQFSVKTVASFTILIMGADGTLLGTSDPYFLPTIKIGQPFDLARVQGLEAPFNAALAGVTDPRSLYTTRSIAPGSIGADQLIMAVPVFYSSGGDKNRVVGVFVIMIDAFPTQRDIPSNILSLASRSLLIFLLGAGILGAIFGVVFANGLAKRFKRLSSTTDAWSEGDFSTFIEDNSGDEISQLAERLNDMAKQLQNLLRRRQEMAVSEERNRLARDLHDSAKQQALAASFELGTALTLYERDPQGAKNHLVEADTLVDSVRKELTNLVEELRPQSINGEDFSETLKEHAIEWSHRSGIELNMNIEGNGEMALETRETLLRIAQEALANVARHSSASNAEVSLEYDTDSVTLIIKDDGCGFDTHAHHEGLGLYSMRERAEVSGGSFTIESAPDQGTEIVVTLPKVI